MTTAARLCDGRSTPPSPAASTVYCRTCASVAIGRAPNCTHSGLFRRRDGNATPALASGRMRSCDRGSLADGRGLTSGVPPAAPEGPKFYYNATSYIFNGIFTHRVYEG